MDIKFNQKIFRRLLKLNRISKKDSILAVGAVKAERDFFMDLNFKNVTILNITKFKTSAVSPFKYINSDITKLKLPDGCFDFVFVSASLHHCSSPVGAFCQMYRVAKKGVIVTEPRDSLIVRLGQKAKIIPEYELEAVTDNGFVHGGTNDTAVPNYIYRWTEREFEKIVKSLNPIGKHKFLFFYKFNPSFSQAKLIDHRLKYYLLRFIALLMWPLTLLFRKQGNTLGVVIFKPQIPKDLFPWLKVGKNRKIVFNRTFCG